MKIIKIIIPFILTSFLSCDKKEVNSNNDIYNKNKMEVAIVDFPDTIHINEVYQGNITYASTFDTIIKKLNTHDADITRYIMLIYYPPKNLDILNREFSKIPTDTTYAYKLPDVPIRDIQFKKEGRYQLEWVIKDMIIFDTIKNRKDVELPMKVEETRISKNIVVIR